MVGIKDSSGDWDNTDALLQLGMDDFRVFAGSESFLLQNMRASGVGCISATANINPAAIHQLYADWQSNAAEDMQSNLDEIRGITQRYPVIPAVKATIAAFSNDSQWALVRPPLMPLTVDQTSALIKELRQANFEMPGLID